MNVGKLKVGDLVVDQAELYKEYGDTATGLVIHISDSMLPRDPRRIAVFWGVDPKFGRPIEWDYENDLQRVGE